MQRYQLPFPHTRFGGDNAPRLSPPISVYPVLPPGRVYWSTTQGQGSRAATLPMPQPPVAGALFYPAPVKFRGPSPNANMTPPIRIQINQQPWPNRNVNVNMITTNEWHCRYEIPTQLPPPTPGVKMDETMNKQEVPKPSWNGGKKRGGDFLPGNLGIAAKRKKVQSSGDGFRRSDNEM